MEKFQITYYKKAEVSINIEARDVEEAKKIAEAIERDDDFYEREIARWFDEADYDFGHNAPERIPDDSFLDFGANDLARFKD